MRQEQNNTTSPSSQSLLSNTFELREEDLFGLFSEQLPDSMYLLDLDDQDVPGKIIYTTDAACRPIGTRAKKGSAGPSTNWTRRTKHESQIPG